MTTEITTTIRQSCTVYQTPEGVRSYSDALIPCDLCCLANAGGWIAEYASEPGVTYDNLDALLAEHQLYTEDDNATYAVTSEDVLGWSSYRAHHEIEINR